MVVTTEIKVALLQQLIDLMRHGQLVEAMSAGLPPEHLDELTRMTGKQLAMLAAEDVLRVSLRVDPAEFRKSLVRARRGEADERAIRYYCHNGASTDMFWRHFKLSKRAVNQLRREHMLLAQPGRPPALSDACAQRVRARYRAFPPEMAERDRFIRLHQEFEGDQDAPHPLPLASIFQSLTHEL